jgi:hypothetical protein
MMEWMPEVDERASEIRKLDEEAYRIALSVVRWSVTALILSVIAIVSSCVSLISSAHAEDVTLSWTNPDRTFTMNDAGPYTNPAGTKIYLMVESTSDPAATTLTLPDMKPGTYEFVAVSVDDQGVSSPVSSPATKTVTSFKAPAGSTVYQVVTISNGLWALPIGTLSADTECIVEQTVNGKYAVPQDNVTWSPGATARPPLVVADCG